MNETIKDLKIANVLISLLYRNVMDLQNNCMPIILWGGVEFSFYFLYWKTFFNYFWMTSSVRSFIRAVQWSARIINIMSVSSLLTALLMLASTATASHFYGGSMTFSSRKNSNGSYVVRPLFTTANRCFST